MGYHIYRVEDGDMQTIGFVDDQAQGAQVLESLMRTDGAGYFLIDETRKEVFYKEMKAIGVNCHVD